MSNPVQRFLAEVGRFLAVGGAATVVALLLFNFLVHGVGTSTGGWLGEAPIPAYLVANTVGMLVSYQGSRNFAFKDRPAHSADGGFTAYVVINLATMALPVLCLAVSRDVFGLDDAVSDNIAANVIGLVLGLAARFHLFRTYVFKRPIHLTEMYDEPGLDEDPEVEPVLGGPVSELSGDQATISPFPPALS